MPAIKISKEIIAQNPEYAHLYEVVDFLENAPRILFPNKHEVAVIDIALEEAHELLSTNPHLSLKETLSTVLMSSEDGLSSDVLLKITQKVIAKWEKLSVPKMENELQLA
jgi:hypothetical protein